MNKETSPAIWLFGATRARLLGTLTAQPAGVSLYLAQLAADAETSAGNTSRELKLLIKQGWVERRQFGKQLRYSANRAHPAFPELRALLAKTLGVVEKTRSALAVVAGQIDFAFLFGSEARGAARPDSDIDVAVIGDVPLMDVVAALTPLEAELGRSLNPVVFRHEEFARKAASKHFPHALLRGEKIMLFGDQHELAKVGGVRLAGS